MSSPLPPKGFLRRKEEVRMSGLCQTITLIASLITIGELLYKLYQAVQSKNDRPNPDKISDR